MALSCHLCIFPASTEQGGVGVKCETSVREVPGASLGRFIGHLDRGLCVILQSQ